MACTFVTMATSAFPPLARAASIAARSPAIPDPMMTTSWAVRSSAISSFLTEGLERR
jgi:hypothetical protein